MASKLQQFIMRTERAGQLLATGEWREFSVRLLRKLAFAGPGPEAMWQPKAYAKWLAGRPARTPPATDVSWDVLTVIPPDGAEPLADSVPPADGRVRWLVADCRSRRHKPGGVELPHGLKQKPRDALKFLVDEATADWIFFLPPGARLYPDALRWLSAASVDADIVYGDDDTVKDGERVGPRFHPVWSPERFFHDGYVCAFGMRRSLVDLRDLGLYDLVLRAEEKGARIVRVPECIVQLPERPTLGANEKKAAQLAMSRRKIGGTATLSEGKLRIVAHARREDAVSIMIPFRDRPELLERCLDSMAMTRHKRYELILIDNGSKEDATRRLLERSKGRVLRRDGAFNFAWLNNEGAKIAKHPYLLLLNNDTEITSPDWLDELLAFATRADVGAVGPKLLYPDGKLQHAGVVFGVAGAAAHLCIDMPPNTPGHADQLLVPRNVSAVTGACLMVAKHKWDAVGGMNERAFRVAFNDLDLCQRLRTRGWRTVYTPHAVLVHHESKSRGSRVELSEDRFFRETYARVIADDPYYHPALSRLVPDDRLG